MTRLRENRKPLLAGKGGDVKRPTLQELQEAVGVIARREARDVFGGSTWLGHLDIDLRISPETDDYELRAWWILGYAKGCPYRFVKRRLAVPLPAPTGDLVSALYAAVRSLLSDIVAAPSVTE